MARIEDDQIRSDLQHVLRLTAQRLQTLAEPIREPVLKRELRSVIERATQLHLDETERTVHLDGWPRVGGVDVAATADAQEVVLIELKWGANNLCSCAWDAPKLALALREGEGERAFLIAGAPLDEWYAPAPGAGLLGSAEWDSAALIDRHRAAFAKWRLEVKTRPRKIPQRFTTEQAAEAQLTLSGREWALRCSEISVQLDGWLAVDEQGGTEPIPSVTPVRIEPIGGSEPIQGGPRLFSGEGGAVYLQSQSELLVDERGTADFLPADEAGSPLRHLYTFATPADLAAYAHDRRWLDGRHQKPAALHLEISGPIGAVTISWDRQHLLIDRDGQTMQLVPAPSDWQAFWARAEALGAWNWKNLYTSDLFATDAVGFRFVMAHEGRMVDSMGYRAFPPIGENDPAPLAELLKALGVQPARVLS